MVDDKGVELVVHKVTKMADELFLYARQFLLIIIKGPPPKKKNIYIYILVLSENNLI